MIDKTPTPAVEAVIALPWYRRLRCWAGMCHTFYTESDDSGIWGECCICHRKEGYVTQEELRRYADAEFEAHAARRALAGGGE